MPVADVDCISCLVASIHLVTLCSLPLRFPRNGLGRGFMKESAAGLIMVSPNLVSLRLFLYKCQGVCLYEPIFSAMHRRIFYHP